MSQFECENKRKTCLKKAIPRLNNDLLGTYAERILKSQSIVRTGRPPKVKKVVAMKESQLKEILRPLIPTNTKRPRSKIFHYLKTLTVN